MAEVRIRVNGATATLDIEPQVSLLDALREHLGLTGAKKGCAQGACGACTVLADGERIVSCLALAVQYEGREITTVEGLADGERLHPLQRAFIAHDGLQCGYCTPGQLCSAIGMLAEHRAGAPSAVTEQPPGLPEAPSGPPPALSEAEIRERMSGNLCRCGAYNGIVAAIQEVAATDAEMTR
ncbi:(2Fe-2S)-binding protein [Nonomuraea indica]|uniref:(2Fe-2S)-binding protein n=1 Tax=Nonomuraea indica TaxID=1581193 RepID=A0ABW8AD12_9ACTN